ncbi:phytyl ester synthase 1, chloroplastic isoform X2 [Malania oleifera]|uniref:phytyl ester synthase 1, chloroplastic isoform X2 n=1 Tax=Malania oleifera TaxID=397392 RepID=UPI0025AE3FFF|nr:phytyl ester synthase 1, chloroplastic isoform X2 [Malania oleifera]XP_057963001.1 phytyl ester synthase 1, chloroplastic isoform X2 [Malania oleifera]
MPLLVEAMAAVINFPVSPFLAFNLGCKRRCQVQVRCLGGDNSRVLYSDSVAVDGGLTVGEKERIESPVEAGNGLPGYKFEEKKNEKDVAKEQLEVLWDDGYRTMSVKNYLDIAQDIIRPDGGPPRWFCPVDCGHPLKGSPILLFLPGMDGVGLGLILHHKALGKAFEVRCMHIPVYDRTPFEGLVKFVEETVRIEHASNPNKPVYLVGDSFGGCLALAVAARNPTFDLVLILVNPATSFGRSQLQPLLPVLEALPDGLHFTVPYLLSFIMGDPLKLAMVNIETRFPPALVLEQLSGNLTALLPRLSGLANIIPKETLLWKLKLLKSAAAYANSRLHAVKAEVLVLASGSDNMLPSKDEAERLSRSLQNCIVRLFKDNGHTLLLEDGYSLLTIIKCTSKYRCSRKHDFITDFLPPSMSEFKQELNQRFGLFRVATSPILFSTLPDGKIVKGLAGIPNEGPVLLVGYHMLLGCELGPLVEAFLKEKNIMIRGVAHPEMFSKKHEGPSNEFGPFDLVKLFGGLPVTPRNLFKLFSTKSHILLYPGGAREALHRKGEKYKLLWPNQPEFVRMAARFGATIVPFGTVGEDDIAELILDYNDLMKIPVVRDYIRQSNHDAIRLRNEENLFIPGLLPKIPGRFYYLFGKPIETNGREKMLNEKQHANELYLRIKYEVERILIYLISKREEDPYRSIIERTLYQSILGPVDQVPTFDP